MLFCQYSVIKEYRSSLEVENQVQTSITLHLKLFSWTMSLFVNAKNCERYNAKMDRMLSLVDKMNVALMDVICGDQDMEPHCVGPINYYAKFQKQCENITGNISR